MAQPPPPKPCTMPPCSIWGTALHAYTPAQRRLRWSRRRRWPQVRQQWGRRQQRQRPAGSDGDDAAPLQLLLPLLLRGNFCGSCCRCCCAWPAQCNGVLYSMSAALQLLSVWPTIQCNELLGIKSGLNSHSAVQFWPASKLRRRRVQPSSLVACRVAEAQPGRANGPQVEH